MTRFGFCGERSDELLRVGADHFQVQESHVQLFQVFRKLLVSRLDETISAAEEPVRVLGYALKVCDQVL